MLGECVAASERKRLCVFLAGCLEIAPLPKLLAQVDQEVRFQLPIAELAGESQALCLVACTEAPLQRRSDVVVRDDFSRKAALRARGPLGHCHSRALGRSRLRARLSLPSVLPRAAG
jgi:hypothetical protein